MEQIQRLVEVSVKSVRELGDKQELIGAIVKTIDEIAEQTNLLALNGSSGRGSDRPRSLRSEIRHRGDGRYGY